MVVKARNPWRRAAHRGAALVLVLVLAGCPRSNAEGPIARLASAGQEDLCAEVLCQAIAAARAARTEAEVPALAGAIEWASSHASLECNPAITARQLWQASLRSLGVIEGEAAGLALVASLVASHRPGSVHDRANAESRLETATALRLLAARSRLEAEVAGTLLDWYGGGALDCSVDEHRSRVVQIVAGSGEVGLRTLARRFPPAPDEGRCAPGWLVAEVFDAAPAQLRRVIVDEIAVPGDEARAERVAAALPGTSGELRAALSGFACDAALARARAALEGGSADPAAAVDEACGACASRAEVDEQVRALRRRVAEHYVSRGEAEEAWIALEALPEEDVDDAFRAEVGVPVVFARLEAAALPEAVEMLETLRRHMGASHTDLAPAGEAVCAALVEAADRSFRARDFEEVDRLARSVERLFGQSDATARLDLILLFAEAGATTPETDCGTREQRRARAAHLDTARDRISEAHAGDDDLAGFADESLRAFRAWYRRCR